MTQVISGGGAINRRGQPLQPPRHIRAEVDAQYPPTAFGEDVEIALSLRRHHNPERNPAAGNVEVRSSGPAVISRNTPLSGPPL